MCLSVSPLSHCPEINKLNKIQITLYANLIYFMKVAISEIGLSMLMPILLNHYMFNEVMRYMHNNNWFGSEFIAF